ncbi:MAG: hypothetical protein ACFB2Z_13715 [Maricaulaceae bacterium]
MPTPMTALFLMTLVGTAAAAFFAGAHGVAGGLATARASGAFSLRAGLLCGALIGAASVALTPLDVGVGLISGFWGEPITTNPMRIAAAVAASVVATAAVLGVTAVLGFAAPVGLVLCIAMASIGAVEGGGSAVGLAGGVGALGFALVLATGAGFALTRAGQIGVFRAPRPRDRTPVSIGLGYGLTVALAGLALALALGAGLWAMVALPLAVIAGGLGYALARSGRANVANTLEAADAAHRTPQGFAALAGAACAGAGQAALLAVPARWLAELQARPEALEGGVTSLAVSASVPVSLALVGGYGFGALLLGHRVTCRLGDELAPTGPLGALGRAWACSSQHWRASA